MESGIVNQVSNLLADFEPPKIKELLPEPFLFQGTIFAVNRFEIIRFVAIIFAILFFGIIAYRSKVIPSKPQAAIEFLFDYIKKDIVGSAMAKDHAYKFFDFGITMFCSIFVFNLMGIVPGLNLAGTAAIGVPLCFALWCFSRYWIVGIKRHGFFGFLKHELFPPGIAWPVYFLLAPIEFTQLIFFRPFSLTLRLFANMMSGHMMLGLCLSATQFFMFESLGLIKGLGFVTLLAGIVFTLFEVLVAFLQAMIFTILGCSYIELSWGEIHQENEDTNQISNVNIDNKSKINYTGIAENTAS